MTREEAIAKIGEQYKICQEFYNLSANPQKDYPDVTAYMEALDTALSALRPISREQVEKVFPGCPYCDMAKANDNIYNKALWVKEAETSKWTLAGKSLQYCPICGRPLTDEAVQMVMERLEALKDGL